MAALTRAPVIVISHSDNGARMLRYPEAPKSASDAPRVLYREGINCRPETAVSEFGALRRKHGKQGAIRKAPAKYLPAGEGETAVYVPKRRPGGRRYWAVAGEGEEATHVKHEGVTYEPAGEDEEATHAYVGRRWVEAEPQDATHIKVAGGYVKQSEAIHMIASFGLDSVNPDDPEDVQRAFDYTKAVIKHNFRATDGSCGVQAKLVAQADAKGMLDENGQQLTEGGKAHVHVVINAVAMKDIELDGKVYKAGSKLSGALTNIDRIRDRHDAFADQHGVEFRFRRHEKTGLESRREKLSVTDRRMRAQGKQSEHEKLRDVISAALADARATDRDGFMQAVTEHGAEHGVEMNHRVTKTGRNKGKESVTYRTEDMPIDKNGKKRYVDKALGPGFVFEGGLDKATGEIIPGIRAQLEENAAGKWFPGRPRHRKPASPKEAPQHSVEELTEARRVMQQLAEEERRTVAKLAEQARRERQEQQEWDELLSGGSRDLSWVDEALAESDDTPEQSREGAARHTERPAKQPSADHPAETDEKGSGTPIYTTEEEEQRPERPAPAEPVEKPTVRPKRSKHSQALDWIDEALAEDDGIPAQSRKDTTEAEPRRQPPVPAEPVAEQAVVRPQPPVPPAAEDEQETKSRKEQQVSKRRPSSKEDSSGQPKKPGGKQEALRRLLHRVNETEDQDDLQK